MQNFVSPLVELEAHSVVPFSYGAVAALAEMSDAEFSRFQDVKFKSANVNMGKFQDGSLASVRNELRRYARQTVPAIVRQEAEKYAPELAECLAAFSTVLLRNQAFGTLDTNKLVRFGQPMTEGQFELEAERAFKRRGTLRRVTKPKIAIVADFNFQTRIANPKYVPTLAPLVQILADACLLAGLEVSAYGVRGEAFQNANPVFFNKKSVSVIATLKEHGETVGGAAYAMLTNESAFVTGFISAFQLARQCGQTTDFTSTLGGCGSKSGKGGIDYARHMGADFVIGIGTFKDMTAPDVCLSPEMSLPDMIRGIHAAMEAKAREAA